MRNESTSRQAEAAERFVVGRTRPGFIAGFVLACVLTAGVSWAAARHESSQLATPVNLYGSSGAPVQTTDAGVLKVDGTVAVSNPAARSDAGETIVVPSGGSMAVSTPVCTSAPQTVVVVGVTAVTVPSSPLAGRKSVRVCVSLENAGSPKVKCALDSHPIMGMVVTDGGSPIGDVMGPGDCYAYPIDTSHTLKCVSDTAGTGVLTWEC